MKRKNQLKITSWQTYKKKNKPDIKYTVKNTLWAEGWRIWLFDYDYGLFKNEKPCSMAKRRVIETLGSDECDQYEYLYHYCKSNRGLYMQILSVYRRAL